MGFVSLGVWSRLRIMKILWPSATTPTRRQRGGKILSWRRLDPGSNSGNNHIHSFLHRHKQWCGSGSVNYIRIMDPDLATLKLIAIIKFLYFYVPFFLQLWRTFFKYSNSFRTSFFTDLRNIKKGKKFFKNCAYFDVTTTRGSDILIRIRIFPEVLDPDLDVE